MSKEEALDILVNQIADYVIGDFCCGKYCPYEEAIDKVVDLIKSQEQEIQELTAHNEELKTITNQYNAYCVKGYGKDTIAFASKEYFDNGTFKEMPNKEEYDKALKVIDKMAEILEELKLCYFKKEDGGEFLGKYRCYNKNDWKEYVSEEVEENG